MRTFRLFSSFLLHVRVCRLGNQDGVGETEAVLMTPSVYAALRFPGVCSGLIVAAGPDCTVKSVSFLLAHGVQCLINKFSIFWAKYLGKSPLVEARICNNLQGPCEPCVQWHPVYGCDVIYNTGPSVHSCSLLSMYLYPDRGSVTGRGRGRDLRCGCWIREKSDLK
jgi:hypothetical protein